MNIFIVFGAVIFAVGGISGLVAKSARGTNLTVLISLIGACLWSYGIFIHD